MTTKRTHADIDAKVDMSCGCWDPNDLLHDLFILYSKDTKYVGQGTQTGFFARRTGYWMTRNKRLFSGHYYGVN